MSWIQSPLHAKVPVLLLLFSEPPWDAHISEIHTTGSTAPEGEDGEKGVKGVLMRRNKEKQSFFQMNSFRIT